MTAANYPHERIEELLSDRAVFGLSDAEQRELDSLLESEGATDDDSLEWLTASLLEASLEEQSGPTLGAESEVEDGPPAELVQRVRKEGVEFFGNVPVSGVGVVGNEPSLDQEESDESLALSSRVSFREVLAWAVAVAAVAVAIVVKWPEAPPTIAESPTAAEMRSQLLADASDVLQIAWLPSKDPSAEEASGDVVWSNSKQRGFMRFRKLQANSPEKQQYQLWIIDGARNAAQPVDGGVFDIPSGVDEVVVPIRAKLQVFDPRAFAVTIEKPGGVVVSDRERLPLLASVGD